ncbi:VOC family protein [Kribbella pratensis]|uniref:Glyoxalase/bleomycin resistance protein/dioxygenase superfamily protein n=1 Tax=Kribbella pratensis TaxID=2512112 RepID=A0A4V3GHV1_9ACTN|nr:VOC family protein [Kribbella pratensis]TDW77517.1 glyoxalase/bleomycin resistance protein/dioxygenase superfamily protein [Kribbella pratensis]
MAIFRLNHAVLYVRDVAASVAFYRDVLGFGYTETGDAIPGAAFLRAPGSSNDHDLGLFQIGSQAGSSGAGRTTVGLYHLAWEVDTLGDLEDLAGRLSEHDALVGASDHGTTKSLYGKDPDGLEFEIVWIIPADLLTDEDRNKTGVARLNLAAEIEKYGPDARSGVGISRTLA